MPRRKTPVERGPPPAYRSPLATLPPIENPKLEQTTPVLRSHARRAPVNPPPNRRISRPRAAKTSKKATHSSWFDLTEEESPPELTEVVRNTSPIPAIPLRSMRMCDLLAAIDVSSKNDAVEETPATIPAKTPAGISANSGDRAPEVTISKPIKEKVPTPSSYQYVEGVCSSDSDNETQLEAPVFDKNDEAVFLPEYFLPFNTMRVKLCEKKKPVLRLTGPNIETGVDHLINNNAHTTETLEPEPQRNEAVCNPRTPIPDLNTDFEVDLNTDIDQEWVDHNVDEPVGDQGINVE